MKLVKQKNSTTCGQSCVAMILNISLDEAIKLIGHNGVTSDLQITKALKVSNIFTLGDPPHEGTYLQKHRNPKDSNMEHWTVRHNGKMYDPACIGDKIWPVYKYCKVNPCV